MAKATQLGSLGLLGEQIACRFLKSRDFKVIGQNLTYKWGEIDLLAKRGEVLHFVEVKTSSADSRLQVRLGERVDSRKLKRLQKSAQTYLAQNNLTDVSWQIDILLILLNQQTKEARVKFLEQVTID